MACDYSQTNPVAYVIPLLILAIPLYDISIQILSRIKLIDRKEAFFSLLTKIGFTQIESLMICYLITFVLGMISLVILKVTKGWALVILGYTIAGMIFTHNKIYRAKAEESSLHIKEIRRLFFNWLSAYKKIEARSFKAILKKDLKILSWLITDIILVNTGIYIAYLTRFDGIIDPVAFVPYLYSWQYITAAHLVIFAFFKLYYHPNNFSKFEIFLNSVKATTTAALASICVVYFFRAKTSAFPSLVFIIGWFFNIILISGWRVFIRYENFPYPSPHN